MSNSLSSNDVMVINYTSEANYEDWGHYGHIVKNENSRTSYWVHLPKGEDIVIKAGETKEVELNIDLLLPVDYKLDFLSLCPTTNIDITVANKGYKNAKFIRNLTLEITNCNLNGKIIFTSERDMNRVSKDTTVCNSNRAVGYLVLVKDFIQMTLETGDGKPRNELVLHDKEVSYSKAKNGFKKILTKAEETVEKFISSININDDNDYQVLTDILETKKIDKSNCTTEENKKELVKSFVQLAHNYAKEREIDFDLICKSYLYPALSADFEYTLPNYVDSLADLLKTYKTSSMLYKHESRTLIENLLMENANVLLVETSDNNGMSSLKF